MTWRDLTVIATLVVLALCMAFMQGNAAGCVEPKPVPMGALSDSGLEFNGVNIVVAEEKEPACE